tara:strand:+ start:1146 stop:1322 length:177 start_codon:yes stop_codon:yes gene_type:complete
MRYEVRVKKLIYDFYQVEADNPKQAKLRALNLKKVGKVDTIRMKPEADYALEVNDKSD